jgi:hypothetical protein
MTAGQGTQFLWLAVSSRAELSAEVLFLRKQLAFYQEHQVQTRKLTTQHDSPWRYGLNYSTGERHW